MLRWDGTLWDAPNRPNPANRTQAERLESDSDFAIAVESQDGCMRARVAENAPW